ncbi:MAG: hypothetical protein AB9873_12035 [Syntrophobacteraceae bacterium]
MRDNKCPLCGSKSFYVKDPDDEYETYEFELRESGVAFAETVEETDAPEIDSSTNAFCSRCSWHGSLGELDDTGKSR